MSKEKKKGGFLKRTFGFKSKDDKLAEEAAKKAQEQAQIDAQMADRMAAINAAALKAARAEDEKKLSEAEKERLEAQERKQAEEQAKKDAEAAKRLIEEKREREQAAKREAERLEAERLENERLETERKERARVEAERLKQEKLERERREQERLAKEAEAAEKAKQEHEAQIAALAASEKAEAEKKAELERIETQKKAKEAAEAARIEAERVERKRDEAARQHAEIEAKEAENKAERERQDFERSERDRLERERIEHEKRDADAREAKQKATETPAAETLAGEQAAETTPRAPDTPAAPVIEKGGFFARITKGLKKSTTKMSDNLSAVFTKRKLDAQALEDLEDLLIAADFGVGPATRTTQLLAKDRFDKQVTDMEIKIALADVIGETLKPLEKPLTLSGAKPEIMLFVGVNGSGKTTTLGKIAKTYTDEGKKVLLCAGDTFRAAAVEQLKVWGERSHAPVVSGPLGADAAGLVYDAIKKAKAEDYDILMIDTAGRLQNRTELMDELAKIVRVIKKQDETAPQHTILVLDATVGQNALSQTEAFLKTAGVTGLIMTKLDGTAKGGVLVALSDKFKLPIHAIGIGERIEDLEHFSADVFAAALSGVADAVIAADA